MRFILFLLMCLACLGCSLFRDTEQPEVISIDPSGNSIGIDALSTFTVRFSEKMEKPVTERAFSFRKEFGNVEGYLWWEENGSALRFRAASPLQKGGLYQMTISKSAEDTDGNDLIRECKVFFSVSSENTSPRLIGTYPQSGSSGISLNTNIHLLFSEGIDKSSLDYGFLITPSIEYRILTTNFASEIIIDPLNPLQNGILYTLKFDGGIRDKEGNPLYANHQVYFKAGSDSIPPSLALVRASNLILLQNGLNEGFEKDSLLFFQFSEAMDQNSVQAGISFLPPVAGNFIWTSSSNMFFRPAPCFDNEQVYQLFFADTISDLSGNTIINPPCFSLKVNGSNSLFAKVIDITNEYSGAWIQNQALLITPDGKATNIAVKFSVPMNQTETMPDVSVRYLYGTGSSGIGLGDMEWKFSDTVLIMDFRNLASGNTYRLTIQGGLSGVKDKKGNIMKEDFIIDFKT